VIESEHDDGNEVAGPDNHELGSMMLDRAHLGEGFKLLIEKLTRGLEADPFRG
jgi:hypothetical protein